MKRMGDQMGSNDAAAGNKSLQPAEKVARESGVEAPSSKPEINRNEPECKIVVTTVAESENGMSSSTLSDAVISKDSVHDDGKSHVSEVGVSQSDTEETVSFCLVFGKMKYNVTEPLDETVAEFKESVAKLTGVPPSMQKLMFKGMLKDGQTLRESKFTSGCKIMLIGSTPNQIAAANTAPKPEELVQSEAQASAKTPLCKQKQHAKVLEKGIPEDAMPGIKNARDSLPVHPISGMINKMGSKVRITFKLELDQLWLGTKERTEKIMMGQIKNVVSEPIEGHEEYHIVGLQLGPTEASLYWLYWVPAQYVAAIKEAIIG